MSISWRSILALNLLWLPFAAFSATTKSEDPEALSVTVVLSDKELETAAVGKSQYIWLVDADDGFSGKAVSVDKDQKTAVFKVENKTFWSDANIKKRKSKTTVYKREEAKRKKEEADRKRKEMAEKREKELEAKRKKIELEKKRKELELLKKRQDAEKKRAELAEARRQKLLEMKKKQEEADRKRKELEDKRRAEEDKRKEDERKKKEAFIAQKKKEALEEKRRVQEAERKKRQEEERRSDAIRKLQEEEARKLADEERRLKEEEARLRGEPLPPASGDKRRKEREKELEQQLKNEEELRLLNDHSKRDKERERELEKKEEKERALAQRREDAEKARKESQSSSSVKEKVEISEEVGRPSVSHAARTSGDAFEVNAEVLNLYIARALSLGLSFGYRMADHDVLQLYASFGQTPALADLALSSNMFAVRYLHYFGRKIYSNTGLGLQSITTKKSGDVSGEETTVTSKDIVFDAALGSELAWRPFGAMHVRVDWVGFVLRLQEQSLSRPGEKENEEAYNDSVKKQVEDQESIRKYQLFFLRVNFGLSF